MNQTFAGFAQDEYRFKILKDWTKAAKELGFTIQHLVKEDDDRYIATHQGHTVGTFTEDPESPGIGFGRMAGRFFTGEGEPIKGNMMISQIVARLKASSPFTVLPGQKVFKDFDKWKAASTGMGCRVRKESTSKTTIRYIALGNLNKNDMRGIVGYFHIPVNKSEGPGVGLLSMG